MSLLQEIIELLTGGIAEYGTGLGSALSEIVKAMFIAESTVEGVTTQHLSDFAVVCVVFISVGLAVSVCVAIWKFLTSFGART